MDPQEEMVQDERFVLWIKLTAPLYTQVEFARALGATPDQFKKILKTGKIPRSVYKHSRESGFVAAAHAEVP